MNKYMKQKSKKQINISYGNIYLLFNVGFFFGLRFRVN